MPIPCSYDLELAAAKYLHSLPDGVAPMALHFNGTVYYRGDDGALQMVLVPWTKSIDFKLPVAVWREAIEHYFPDTAWTALGTGDARGAPAREAPPRAGHARRDGRGAARRARR